MQKYAKLCVAALLYALLASPAAAACWQWSLTASANATADPSINWSEGMAPSGVNDSARAMMARLAECRDDLSGKLVGAGTSTAYTLTTNQGFNDPPENGQAVTFRPGVTNAAAVTLQTDGGTAYPIRSDAATAIVSGAMIAGTPYTVTFNSSASAWIVHSWFAVTTDLDQFCATRGAILERGASGWACTVPGASGTVFTSNGTGADPTYQAPPAISPQGYLTITSNTPVSTGDVTAATIYYTPDIGNYVPLYNGTNYVNTVFTQLQLDLSVSQASNQIYDVCIFSDAGTVRAGFTPAWATATAGAGARGTGAGTPELVRVLGFYVNANSMTVNNGASTYSVAAQRCTYVGSLHVNAAAGNVSVLKGFGQSRKIGIWNAFNRKPLTLQAGDNTASWNYSTTTLRPSNNNTANSLTVFSGLADEPFEIDFIQQITNASGGSPNRSEIAIGWNSTTALSGIPGWVSGYTTLPSTQGTGVATLAQPPALGINVVTGLELADGGTGTFNGTASGMRLRAKWRG